MATRAKTIRLILHALMILVYISPTFNAYSEEDLEKLADSFDVEMEPGVGGSCNRNIESNGEEMVAKVIDAFEDALELITAGIENPNDQIKARDENDDSAQAFTRLRGLLFVFFGIRISSDGQFDEENLEAYNIMLGKLINPLSFSKLVWVLIPAKSNRRVPSGRCHPHRSPGCFWVRRPKALVSGRLL